MSRIFLSYRAAEVDLAREIATELTHKGHDVRFDEIGLVAGDDWRKVLMDELRSSEVVVVLLSQESLRSHFVMAEIGATRAFNLLQGIFLIPVIVGEMSVPPIIGDLYAVRVGSPTHEEWKSAAEQIDRAIAKNLDRSRGRFPLLFISHRHLDEDVATALVRLFEVAFLIEPWQIRCTSVDPYRLPAAIDTAERLRAEINRAKAVLGIITPAFKDSSYVLFELGACWGQNGVSLPTLAKGATLADIPAPIAGKNALRLTEERDCYKLLQDLPSLVGFRPRDGVAGQTADKIDELVERARGSQAEAAEEKQDSQAKTAVANAAAKKKLKTLLRDPAYPDGRYLETLCAETKLRKAECRRLLIELGAREINLEEGEGWTFKPRK